MLFKVLKTDKIEDSTYVILEDERNQYYSLKATGKNQSKFKPGATLELSITLGQKLEFNKGKVYSFITNYKIVG